MPPSGTTTGTEPDRPAALRLPGLETATAFRECFSDFEAVSTGSFSKKGEQINGRSYERRPGKAQPPPGIKATPCLEPSPGGAALARAYGV